MAGQAVYTREPSFDDALSGNNRNVTTAGTAVQLSVTSIPCIEVLIQAKAGNTGQIWIGGVGVTNSGTNGVVLMPTSAATDQPRSIQLSAKNLNQIYINSTNNGEGVTFIYW